MDSSGRIFVRLSAKRSQMAARAPVFPVEIDLVNTVVSSAPADGSVLQKLEETAYNDFAKILNF